MMRINIDIDEELLQEAQQLLGIKTKKEIVNMALGELVANRKRKNIMDLKGTIEFFDDYDHKQLRESGDFV